MIITHRVVPGSSSQLERHMIQPGEVPAPDAVWYDLVEPTNGDDRQVEKILEITIPTREEMKDIEPSSILYREGNALHMTARILCQSESDNPRLIDASFILTQKAMVTVRYDDPRAFQMFASRLGRPDACGHEPAAMLDGLIDSIVDRAGEVLRRVGEDIESLSHSVFAAPTNNLSAGKGFGDAIRRLGRIGDLTSHVRESMVSLDRMLLFLASNARRAENGFDLLAEWQTDIADVKAIEDHAEFLAGKTEFMLNATLGLVSLEQNNIVKIFSVLAVIFMPPTLIASIYGMNFKSGMWELEWEYGYALALCLMVLSCIATFSFLKWKRWL